ncbi:MAG TPA: hypothetical protein VEC99_14595 [Clostridia bacterium]|nr:hypothetical protein [Clostridia bacterium]
MLLATDRSQTTQSRKSARLVLLLTDLEIKVNSLFVQIYRLLSQPRFLAEIYSLLFLSTRPLAMDGQIARCWGKENRRFLPLLVRMVGG